MGSVVSKRRPRSLLLIIPRPAASVPPQAGRRGAGGRASDQGRPAAAHDWEEGPVTRPKGGASVLRTGGRPRRSFLPLRTLRAADLLSLPLAPAAACSVSERWVGKRGIRRRELLR